MTVITPSVANFITLAIMVAVIGVIYGAAQTFLNGRAKA